MTKDELLMQELMGMIKNNLVKSLDEIMTYVRAPEGIVRDAVRFKIASILKDMMECYSREFRKFMGLSVPDNASR